MITDFLFVLITLAFFGLCVLYVHALDRIIHNDDIGNPSTRPVEEQSR